MLDKNHHMIDGVKVPFTEAEEAALKEQAAAWEAGATDRALERLRRSRDKLLKLSDWTQVPDSALSNEKKAEWAAYRTALRDLPATTSDAANPVWPDKPA
tara:strand:+ start:165 stop:464 length:300 start_codon:yes stop_codon:yes gene_type:complete